MKEWDANFMPDGEKSLIHILGMDIIRWILPKHGVAYGWRYGKFVLAMYGPNAEDEDMRNFMNTFKPLNNQTQTSPSSKKYSETAVRTMHG
jgi:hypothetical protein